MKNFSAATAVVAFLALGLAACDSGITPELGTPWDEAGFGKSDKVVVCHVDSGTGAIRLLAANPKANHLGNPGHTFGGVSDYLPDAVFATGIGSGDSDGNGVDDGCEPATDPTAIATITADIVRGGTPPGQDRGVESAAVNLVADAQRWATASNGAQIAFMNPGGVRTDLTYLQSGSEGDGVVTFSELFAFQPFGNTLVTVPMTGAQIIQALEQQCQPSGSGRPFLHLGVSQGLTYDLSSTIVANDCVAVTVGNVALNGVSVEPGASYYVTVNSFLAGGGDNFAVFNTVGPQIDGGNDLLALVKYMRAFSPVSPPSTDRVNEL